MRIVQSKVISAVDIPDGLITNTHVNAAAAIDATKLDLSAAELAAAETAGTSVLLSMIMLWGY